MGNPEAAVREYPSVLAVAQGYGLDVTSYAAVPGGYLLDAATGKYWLKPFAGSEKELDLVVAASEHLERRGFPYQTRSLRLRDASPGIRFRRVLFCLVEAAPGAEPRLDTLEALREAGERLGWFHLAARAFDPPADLADVRREWGSCERVFKERLLDLYDFQETCADRPRRTRFDGLYLEHFNDFVDAAREAVDIVAELPLREMIAVARADRQFCHGDFAPAALAVSAHGELVITDLDMMRFDLRVVDVAEFIRTTSDFDPERAGAFLQGYHAAFPLAAEDVRLIEAYLRFPRDYWRAANAYYREGINTRARLSEVIANYQTRQRFIDSFRHLEEQFPASQLYLDAQPEAPFSEAPDGFFPPAAFSGPIADLNDEVVPGSDGPAGEEEAADGPEGEPLTAPTEEPAGEPAPAWPGRRRTLPERCLFDEPLPPRRRGAADAPPSDGFAAPWPGDTMAVPAEPLREDPPEAVQPAGNQPPVETAPSGVPYPEIASVVSAFTEVLPPPVADPGSPPPTATVAEAITSPTNERRKIVWRFPPPLVKQEDTQ